MRANGNGALLKSRSGIVGLEDKSASRHSLPTDGHLADDRSESSIHWVDPTQFPQSARRRATEKDFSPFNRHCEEISSDFDLLFSERNEYFEKCSCRKLAHAAKPCGDASYDDVSK